jgi:GH25 family lysozyme M1 (1,4-beta-N-acetylmuramidase)
VEVALLIALVVLCLPYFEKQEEVAEPAASLEYLATEETEETLAEEVTEETEPQPETEPTIPPEANPYTVKDFQYDEHNYLYCLRQDSYKGVDVSAFQGDIDWQQVKDSGIDFAIIRLGYRGYGKEGKLVEDEYVQDNLAEATEVGLPIGAYFFSQALNIKEVDEEIEFMLEILGEYQLDLPIILDWEIPGVENPRSKNMDARTLTEIQKYFSKVMTEKGYDPMIYFNWNQAKKLYYLSELEDYDFWLAFYQDRMTFPYKVEMWQYTDQGRVPGIEGNVDLNVYMPS